MSKEEKIRFPWLITFSLGITFFLGGFDMTGLNLALVSIQKDLNLPLSSVDWILNGYLITFGAFLIPSGRFADLFGYKILFLVGVAIFGIASLLGGISIVGWQLILSRVLQGLGAAMFWPIVQSVVMSIFPKETVGKAMGLIISMAGVGVASGPILSGLLLQNLSWRFVLFINIPITLLAFFIVLFFLPKQKTLANNQKIDLISMIFFVLFSYSLIHAIDLGGIYGFRDKEVLGWFAATIGLAWLFVVRQDNTKKPLIQFSLFYRTDFIPAFIFRACVTFGFFSILFFTGYTLQHIAGMSPEKSGLYFLSFTSTFALFSAIGGMISHRVAHKSLMNVGMLLFGLGTLSYAIALTFTLNFWAIILPLIIAGTGFGFFIPHNSIFAIQALPKEHWALASASIYTGVLLASSTAIVIASAFMRNSGSAHALNLLQKAGLKLSQPQEGLIQSVMRGRKSIQEVLFHFPDHKNAVFTSIKNGFIYAMTIDLYMVTAIVLIPLGIYLLAERSKQHG